MDRHSAIAIVGTFDSEGQEHLFFKKCIEKRGLPTMTIHVGTKAPSPFPADVDLYVDVIGKGRLQGAGRDEAIAAVIGPQRLAPIPGMEVPRLVVPGGLDCAVLEFTRDPVPDEYRDRKIFFYDFRSAVRLDERETLAIVDQLAEKLNRAPALNKVLIPLKGWSEADRADTPLYDPDMRGRFIGRLKEKAAPEMDIGELDHHINDEAFARAAAQQMDEMVREGAGTP